MHPRRISLALLIVPLLCACAPAAAEPALKLEVATDRPEATYRAGESAVFRISLKRDGKPIIGEAVQYVISKDGVGELESGSINTAEKSEVKRTLTQPGFLRCNVTHNPPATRPITASAGAAFDPEQIAPSMPAPEDFGEFWESGKKRLVAEPAKPVLTPVDSPDAAVEVFDVQINCPGGAPVSGYLARPKGAAERSIGAILYPHSAGVRSSDLPHAVKGAKLGLIALDFNAHGLPNGRPPEFYADLAGGALKGYPGFGAKDRESIYFYGMILRVMRALDFLAQQPQWNGNVLIVEGSSQGGGQALIAAGLDPRVTLCIASVPAMCDHTGFAVERAIGWPRVVPKDAEGKYDEKATQAARYVDAMNFAPRIKCPTYVAVGFIDHVCPPTSVYAAYNNIPRTTKKKIVNRPTMGHAFPPDLIAHFDDVIRQHVAEMKR